ncbi:nitrogen permease regulator 2-domain-containing protein [Syncephalastrum racemosum]|uniref:Nitrogen permease regulator 2-domain-containing protein n=1 Tax=Syncephalastrum racemosum TaxID=13706 RepID=A0A1X2H0C7_SYNRA|nr:nitrogen permease regulator 2-domain-containing protein [Syncephalastrum racemosum]
MEFQGFPRIHAVFYAVFNVIKGTVCKHQVPEGSVTPYTPVNAIKPLIDFEAISEYIIPKELLYNRLVIINTETYKVMGCPVVIHDHVKYGDARNEFRFNLCFIFERSAETSSYEAVVRKLARVLEALEIECDFLSQDANLETRTVQNVIEQLFEDLNSYCECQIPINSSNTINLKLFPTYPNPPEVHDYQVPVCTVDLQNMTSVNWDLTVQKIAAHIDGIRHVRAIAELANVKPEWARQSLQHLMYYGCIIMTDIFQFSNVYAVKPEITRMLDDKSGLAQECLQYITLPDATPPSLHRIFSLFCALQYGSSIRDWIDEHQVNTLPIDVRRFISFGVIKGLIYRVHKYPILTHMSTSHEPQQALILPTRAQYSKLININTGQTIHPDIIPYLDGCHHYDEICTALYCSPHELDEQLGFRNSSFDAGAGVASSLQTLGENYRQQQQQQQQDMYDGIVTATTMPRPQQQQPPQPQQPQQQKRIDGPYQGFPGQWCVRFIYR